MDAWKADGEKAVGFVFDHAKAPFAGHGEIDPGDPHVGAEEFLAQAGAGDLEQGIGILGIGHTEFFMKDLADVDAGEMEGRRSEVGGDLVEELDDILAEVGLQGLDVVGTEKVVEIEFLGGQGLGLDHALHLLFAHELEDDGARLLRIPRPVDHDAVLLAVLLKELEIAVEVVEGLLFGLVGLVAELLPPGELFHLVGALFEGGLGRLVDRLAQPAIRQGFVEIGFGVDGGGVHHSLQI
ncbi:MAG: hypothetical protein BWY77_01144 [bacterium ADurb.Bin431]|nr:MAG: hypothetical protein BWY77_01144 [bacterium ADurb.Bin431]